MVGLQPVGDGGREVRRAADRGLAGGYSSNIIREAEALTNLLKDENVAASHFLVGRKAVNFFRFRERPIAGQWTGFTDQPRYQDAVDIANGLLAALKIGRAHV